ncbi:MAG: sensor histidine kinase, partial [Bacillota bacterium]
LNKINDISLNYKFMLIYIMCVIVPILTISLFFLDSISGTIREREEENFRISYDRAKTDIVSAVEECVAVSHSISTDRTIYDEMDKQYKDENEYYDTYNNSLRDKVTRYITIYNNVSDICIYTANSTIVNGGNYFKFDDIIRDKLWYKRVIGTDDKVLLYAYREARQNTKNRYNGYLSLIRRMNEYGTPGSNEKILKIDIDISRFYEIFHREQSYLALYLVDSQGRIVCSSNSRHDNYTYMDFPRLDTVSYDKNDIVFDDKPGDALYFKNWRLIGIADKEIVLKAIGKSRYFVFFLTLISMLVSSLLVFIILRSYNLRIKKLSKHMSKLGEEQFDLIDLNEGKDEIGGLIRSFNKMAAKINILINDVYKLQIQKKDLELERVHAELNFLQSQMNPHFLFNTLNAILVVSVKNNYTEIIDVIKYLSKTLRRLLSWRDDLVTVEEEISFTEMYLKIEKFRFGEKFKYTVLIDEKAIYLKIPKMSIQPLVENACKHGIQSIKGTGSISIKALLKDQNLKVVVADDGGGIPGEKLDEIMLNMADGIYKTGSIGIRNVYRRLKLYYGEDFQFRIDSKIDEGTKVSFTIPIINQ